MNNNIINSGNKNKALRIKIPEVFKAGKTLITFIAGGDPDIETTEKIITAMAENGSGIIEIGIPFSDPIAEGPVIQSAYARALKGGCTVDKLFGMVERLREKIGIPLLFMTYSNPIFFYGKEKFMRRCAECGIDGIIIPDLPFEEKEEFQPACLENGITLISLVAPTSGGRADKIAAEAEGFLYCVSSLGVTGMRREIDSGIAEIITHIKQAHGIPCAVGFGISNAEQAAETYKYADGVIVGSAIVDIAARYGRESAEKIGEFVKTLRH